MYLFLAVPNFCGSTLLHSLLETCPEVVPLTDIRPPEKQLKGMVEGNCCAPYGYANLQGPHSMEANMEHVYADPKNYNWNLIRQAWDENWTHKNPHASIRMQKTPADIFRVQMMLPYFDPLRWIIMVRNPYCHVESIMRKATFKMDPIRQLDQVCFHALRCLGVQIGNAKLLGSSAYTMTYENFVSQPEFHRAQLEQFLPGLGAINFDAEMWLKGKQIVSIKDDSEEKFARLVEAVPGITDKINKFFKPFEPILNHWGYKMRGASKSRTKPKFVK